MKKNGEGGGLAWHKAQFKPALSHHRAQHAGNHLCICHKIPGRRREPESKLPYQAPAESVITNRGSLASKSQ